jgi:hypothetical protein
LSSGCATWTGAAAVTEDGSPSVVSAFFLVHEAHGADDTAGALPDEKSESAPGKAIANAATAAAEAAEAIEAERTQRRRSALVRSSGKLSADTTMESRIAPARTAISRDHALHAAQPRR